MIGFEYFKLAFSRYADFTGRSRRSEYWYFALFTTLVSIFLGGLSFGMGAPVLGYIWSLVTFIPYLAVAVRRLHDIGKSGWYLLIGFIPVIGLIFLIVWFCTDGEYGSNQWGPNPKDGDTADVIDHYVDDTTV